MNIYKDKGLIYSEYILNAVTYSLMDYEVLEGKVDLFYNCREQGYVLRIHDKEYEKSVCIWICANRHSDEPMIVWDYILVPTENGNRYSEDAWENRNKVFSNIEEAVSQVKKIIKEYFFNDKKL